MSFANLSTFCHNHNSMSNAWFSPLSLSSPLPTLFLCKQQSTTPPTYPVLAMMCSCSSVLCSKHNKESFYFDLRNEKLKTHPRAILTFRILQVHHHYSIGIGVNLLIMVLAVQVKPSSLRLVILLVATTILLVDSR